jgi:hypothetical protein
VEVAKSTDIIGLISKELAVSNSLISPTNQSFSKPPKNWDIHFFKRKTRSCTSAMIGPILFKIHFGYLFVITTQKGGSKPMDLPFLFFQSSILRDSDLTVVVKMR